MTATAAPLSTDSISPTASARVASAGALAAVGALVTSFIVLPADDGGSSAAAVADRYAADGYLPAVVVQVVGVLAALVFAGGLSAVLPPPVRSLVLGGAAVAVGLQLTGYALIATLASGTAARGGDDVVLALYDLSSVAFAFGSGGWAVCLGAAAAGLLSTGVLGRWAAVSAAAVAAVCLGATGALAADGFLGLHGDFGFLAVVALHLWLMAVGVALLRRRRS
jgi:hypothetical protein